MIQDLLVSFKENIKTKSSNPFLGTLILVWFFKNWNLFYSLFNFEPNTTLIQKREFIITHFSENPIIETLLWCILESFVIVIVSYFLINLSRLIVNFYEKRLTPLIYKWTDEKSIVLKSVYENSENARKKVEKRLEEEHDAKLKVQEDYDKLEKKYIELVAQKSEAKEIENQNVLESLSTPERSKSDNKINLILNKLERDKQIDAFEKVVSDILNEEYIQKSNNYIIEFATMGLVTPKSFEKTPDLWVYTLTELGKDIHEKIMYERFK